MKIDERAGDFFWLRRRMFTCICGGALRCLKLVQVMNTKPQQAALVRESEGVCICFRTITEFEGGIKCDVDLFDLRVLLKSIL